MQICWAYRGNSVRLSQLGNQLVADFRQFFDFLVLKNKQWDDALYVPRWKDYGEIVLRLPIPSLGIWLSGSSLFCIRNPFKESFLLVASVVSNSVSPWTVACQAPPSMEFSRQEYWTGLPFPSSRDLPDPGMKSQSPALQAVSLLSEPSGKPFKERKALYLLP